MLEAVKSAAEVMEQKLIATRQTLPEPVVAQLDITRDLKGTFYVVGDWPVKHSQLKRLLEKQFKTKLSLGKNSFNSCFQFEEEAADQHLFRRFKVYNKILQLLQSETPQKAVGMNTNALFNPPSRLLDAIVESRDAGMTRLEISYYAKSTAAQAEYFEEDFESRAVRDLDRFNTCLNQLKGACFRLPLLDLLESFQTESRSRQVFLQQPNICALFFARSDKRGSYIGFFKNIPKKGPFDPKKFLAAHALPGPNSKIACEIVPRGSQAQRQVFIYKKDAHFSQIPGFCYWDTPLDIVPRPAEWTAEVIEPAILATVKLNKID